MELPEAETKRPLNSGLEPNLTCGDYRTEEISAMAFDAAVEKSGLFKVWKEIMGEMIHPLPGMNNKDHYRLDRILVATDKLTDAGWNKGLIGVELKKSGIKAGPPLSQMLDYLRCAWTTPKNVKVLIDYCFLWPLPKCGRAVASIMAQNHIGACCLQYHPDSEFFRLGFSSVNRV